LVFALVVVAVVAAAVVRTRRTEPGEISSTPVAATLDRAPEPEVAPPALTPRPPLPSAASAAENPQPAAAPTVLVSLRSTPPGAMVMVNGKEYGPTPAQLEWSGPDAAPGREVTFRFQRKGYRDLTVTRQIRADRLDVEAPPMDPVPVYRPSRAARAVNAPPSVPKAPSGILPLKGYKEDPY
jgi:serine/threonine-protein kinase